MGKKQATVWVAVLVAALTGGFALLLPRAPQQTPAAAPPPAMALGADAAPPALVLVQPGLVDVVPDDKGNVSLLSRSEANSAGDYLLTTVAAPSEQASPDGSAAASNAGVQVGQHFRADAAWLVGPATTVAWAANAPTNLLITSPSGRTDLVRNASRPALVTAAGDAGAGAAGTVVAVIPKQASKANTQADEPAGDRLVRLSGGLQDLARLAEGVITAVAEGPDGSLAFASAEPGKPAEAGITVLKPDGSPAWRATLRSPAHRLAFLDQDTVAVAVGQELLAVRRGEVAWRRNLPAVPVGLGAAPDAPLLVAMPNKLLALGASGFTRWELTPRRPIMGLRLAPAGTRAALIESGQTEILKLRER